MGKAEEDICRWKKDAMDIMRNYYLRFEGTQWHKFDPVDEKKFIKTKICYSIFGLPSEEKAIEMVNIEDAYTKKQQDKAQEIYEVLLKIYSGCKAPNFMISFLVVACKAKDIEFTVPVFSILVDGDVNGNDIRWFVDTDLRTYKTWNDWKKKNTLPKVNYAYPKNGFYTCSNDFSYAFDPSKDPDVEYGKSPSSSTLNMALNVTDGTTAVLSMAAGAVGIASLFTPLGPVLLVSAAIAGGSSAVYGTGRGIGRLYDKETHGQSLHDLESLTIWVGMAAMPFSFVTSAINGALAIGARQGRILSSSMRMFATILNFSTLALDTIMLGFGISDMIKKSQDGKLTPMYVMQFSMSVFFFGSTVMQPKVASSMIKRAQEHHFDRISSSLSDQAAKDAFQKYLDNNKVGGTITDRSKIVRSINHIKDPNIFFKCVGTESTVAIGGRKGRTVLVTDQHGNTSRINQKEVIYTEGGGSGKPINSKPALECLKNAHGKQDLDEVTLNGTKIFKDLNDREKKQISASVNGAARSNEDIIRTAHVIAEKIGIMTSEHLMDVVQIVATIVKGEMDPAAIKSTLENLDINEFVNNLKADMNSASEIAERCGMHFTDSLKAVYHFHKHGAEFPAAIRRFGNNIKTYLGPVRDQVLADSNLEEICSHKDGTVMKIYVDPNDRFGVVTSTPDGTKIRTMFVKPGNNVDYVQKLREYSYNSRDLPNTANESAQMLAQSLGLERLIIGIVMKDGSTVNIDEQLPLDESTHRHMATVLSALSS